MFHGVLENSIQRDILNVDLPSPLSLDGSMGPEPGAEKLSKSYFIKCLRI